MNLVVTLDEICTAPIEVQKWFAGKLACISAIQEVKPEIAKPEVAESKPEVKPEPKPEPKPEVLPPSIEAVMEAATSYITANGTDSLKAVLSKFGISRARECPADKRAEFLAALAVA